MIMFVIRQTNDQTRHIMDSNRVRLSKFLSLVLRHRAQDFGLTPDAEGFVPLDALLSVVQHRFDARISQEDIRQLVETGQPRRFELREGFIRATYGHSYKTPVSYPPVAPPPVLYHGTHPRALDHIRREGLHAMKRQYVHLSTTVERAQEVARRRTDTPIILTVRAAEAHAAGIVFHSPEAKHYLAENIPPEFIQFP